MDIAGYFHVKGQDRLTKNHGHSWLFPREGAQLLRAINRGVLIATEAATPEETPFYYAGIFSFSFLSFSLTFLWDCLRTILTFEPGFAC